MSNDTSQEKAKLPNWENIPTVEELKKDYSEAEPYTLKNIQKIDGYLDNLYTKGSAKPAFKNKDKRSTYVPKLIRKHAEWRYAALTEPFLSTPDLFNTAPVTFEDTKAAEQNQLVLNYQFNNKIDKIKLIEDMVHTGVNEGTIICKVLWEYEEKSIPVDEPVFEFRPTQNPQFLALINAVAQGQVNDLHNYLPEIQKAIVLSVTSGNPVYPVQTGMKTTMETKVVKNNPTVEVCDYRSVTVDPSAMGDISKANFIVHEFRTSKAALLEDGRYFNLDKVNFQSTSATTRTDEEYMNTEFAFDDELRKTVSAFEHWGYKDISGKGVLEPIVATYIDGIMVRLERNPFPHQELPFVIIPYLPVKNSLYGEPDGILIEDNQKISGAVMRGVIDMMARSAAGQVGTRKDALDISNKRKFDNHEPYEFNMNVTDPASMVYVHKFSDIPQSAEYVLNMQNQDADGLTGVKSFSNGIAGQALGNTATGIRSALDASSKRELAILRRISAGLVKIARLVMAMNTSFLDEEEIVRVTNEEFVHVKRDDLKGEIDIKVAISTAEADDQKANEISFMLQTTAQTLPFELTKKMLSNVAKLRNMPELAKDIENYQQQPDPVQQEMAQLELEEKRITLMDKKAEAKLKLAKAEEALAKARNIGSEADLKDLDYLDKDSGAAFNKELQLRGEQARANEELEMTKHNVKMQEQDAANVDNTNLAVPNELKI